MIKEATLHLACPEACFQATTEAGCFDEIQRWYSGEHSGTQVSYLDCIAMIRQESMTVESQRLFAFLGPLNLFALTSGKLQHPIRDPTVF